MPAADSRGTACVCPGEEEEVKVPESSIRAFCAVRFLENSSRLFSALQHADPTGIGGGAPYSRNQRAGPYLTSGELRSGKMGFRYSSMGAKRLLSFHREGPFSLVGTKSVSCSNQAIICGQTPSSLVEGPNSCSSAKCAGDRVDVRGSVVQVHSGPCPPHAAVSPSPSSGSHPDTLSFLLLLLLALWGRGCLTCGDWTCAPYLTVRLCPNIQERTCPTLCGV